MRKYILIFTVFAFVAFLIGCGSDANEDFTGFGGGGYHPFSEPAEDNHGDYMEDNGYPFTTCAGCHGDDLTGPNSCYDCHNSSSHIVEFSNSSDHPDYLQDDAWDLDDCFNCHSNMPVPPGVLSFGGSCSSANCHQSQYGGASACNNCHGDRDEDGSKEIYWAPPDDIAGNDDESIVSVGAHEAHLDADGHWAQVPCTACHTVPSQWNDNGHIDSALPVQAELNFSSIGSNDQSNPSWNHDNAICSSTYCHFGAQPVWTEVDEDWNQCGMCHTLPPPPPHFQLANCWSCHPNVDASLNIIDPTKHVDGEVN